MFQKTVEIFKFDYGLGYRAGMFFFDSSTIKIRDTVLKCEFKIFCLIFLKVLVEDGLSLPLSGNIFFYSPLYFFIVTGIVNSIDLILLSSNFSISPKYYRFILLEKEIIFSSVV